MASQNSGIYYLQTNQELVELMQNQNDNNLPRAPFLHDLPRMFEPDLPLYQGPIIDIANQANFPQMMFGGRRPRPEENRAVHPNNVAQAFINDHRAAQARPN